MIPVSPKYPIFATAPEEPGEVHRLEPPTEADLTRPVFSRVAIRPRPPAPVPAWTEAEFRAWEAPAPAPIPDPYLTPPPVLVRTPPDPDLDPNPDGTHPSPPPAEGPAGRSSDPARPAVTIRREGDGFVFRHSAYSAFRTGCGGDTLIHSTERRFASEIDLAHAVLEWAHGKD